MPTWGTWTDLSIEYEESKDKILAHKKRLKGTPRSRKTPEKESEQELAASMGSDLTQMHKEIQKKCLYAYNALSQEDLEKIKLTKRQKQILELRLQEMPFREIARELDIHLKNVFNAYSSAILEMKKYKKIDSIEYNLTPQQREIYKLKQRGLKNKEIAKLMEINSSTVKSQLYQIKKVNEKYQHKLGVEVCP